MNDDERSDNTKIMDAIAGGVIGLVTFAAILLFIFKRSTWFEPWMYILCTFAGSLIGAIGSYTLGSEFWDRIFYFFTRK